MTKQELLAKAHIQFSAFTQYCEALNGQAVFDKPGTKWSVAEHIRHLVISTRTSTLAFTLPKFMVRLVAGTPNRPSRTYDALVAKYKKKLEEGGAATGRFIPKPVPVHTQKEQLLQQWKKAAAAHYKAIENNCTEAQLDQYLVKHPLLGRITLRELCYFTIYHTEHHLRIIQSLTPTHP